MSLLIKLLIVDDELYSRKGIRQILEQNLSRKEFCVVGEASDGVLAMEFCENNDVDIVIADIQMPRMDGLDLAKQLKASHPEIHFIIVTGHSIFEYAQRAVKLQTVDFLLKPISKDELILAVTKAREKMEKHKIENKILIAQTILRVIQDKEDISILKSYLNKETYVQAAIVRSYKYDALKEIVDRFNKNIENRISAAWISKKEIFILSNKSEPLKEVLFPYLLQYRQEKENNTIVAISEYCLLESIHDIYQKLFIMIEDGFYLDNNNFIVNIYEPKINYDEKTLEKKVENLIKAFETMSSRSLMNRISDIFKYFYDTKTEKCVIYETLLDISLRIQIQYKQLMEGEKLSKILFSDFEKYSLKQNERLYKDYVLEILNNIKDNIDDLSDSPIDIAIKYINNNYMNPISLDSVSSYVHLNSSYFSRLFKEKLGVSFSNYIFQLKIKKATELLEQGLSVNEASHKVGFNSYRNFTVQFKKYVGVLPSHYRKK